MLYLSHVMTVLAMTLLPGHATRDGRAGDFVGSTPCDAEPRRFLGIADPAVCERIAWHLTLSSDEPRPKFSLQVVYGRNVQNEAGFAGGGTARKMSGTWEARGGNGTSGRAVVYRLISSDKHSISLRRVAHDLLHLVNDRGTLMVGNGGWSYTLSRTDGDRTPHAPVWYEPVSDAVPAAAGRFDGRTPCRELAGKLGAFRVDDSCMKLKWSLKLHQDPVTRAPTRYVLEGTAYRAAPRKGKWTMLRSRSDPKTIVYRLDPEKPGRSLSFVKADDNILLFVNEDGSFLVGDRSFSYTLNRVAPKAASPPPRPVRR